MLDDSQIPLSERPFTTRQRNQIFELVSRAGLNVSDFEFRRIRQKYMLGLHLQEIPEVVLVHKTTGYHYSFTHERDLDSLNQLAVYSPGFDSKTQSRRVYDWGGHLRAIKDWLQGLSQELGTPDLWEEWKRATPLLKFGGEGANSPFTSSEAAMVRRELESVRATVEVLTEISASDKAWINDRFDSLEREIDQLGRLDWRSLLIGVVMEIGISRILTQVQWSDLVRLAGQLINKLFGGPMISAS